MAVQFPTWFFYFNLDKYFHVTGFTCSVDQQLQLFCCTDSIIWMVCSQPFRAFDIFRLTERDFEYSTEFEMKIRRCVRLLLYVLIFSLVLAGGVVARVALVWLGSPDLQVRPPAPLPGSLITCLGHSTLCVGQLGWRLGTQYTLCGTACLDAWDTAHFVWDSLLRCLGHSTLCVGQLGWMLGTQHTLCGTACINA